MPRPRVARPEDDPTDPGRHQRTGAHGARLERDDQRELGEPPPAHAGGGVAQGQDLGMRSRVAGPLPLVVAGGHDPPADQGDRTDGNFPARRPAVLRTGRDPWRPRRSAGGRVSGRDAPDGGDWEVIRTGQPWTRSAVRGSVLLERAESPSGVAWRPCRTARGTSPDEGRQPVDGAQELHVLVDQRAAAGGSRPGRGRHGFPRGQSRSPAGMRDRG